MSQYNILHISIDDTIRIFKELTERKPLSIFDLSFFHYFKRLHDKYGLVLSCYCFFQHGDFTLAECTRNYKAEFEANANWLRFGFHGFNGSEDYGMQNELVSKEQYEQLMDNLAEVVGMAALDSVIRIHRFKASKGFIRQIATYSKYPIQGLFGADDNRLSYFLSKKENELLVKNSFYKSECVMVLKTTQRFDSVKPSSIYCLFTHFRGGKYFFTHECYFFPTTVHMKIKAIIIKYLISFTLVYYKFCLGCVCDFPLNKIK